MTLFFVGWGLCVVLTVALFVHHEWGERRASRKRRGMRVLR